MGAEPDAVYLELEEALQQQLTVGRAISHAPTQLLTDPARSSPQ
jgi:hypothetical protein